MIGFLEGAIHSITAERVIVNVGGVGYLVQIPLSTYYKLEGTTTARLLIHTHVREDALALFGFATEDEKEAFEKLISISGIGPRLGQVILSGIDTRELAEAIVRGDSRRLSTIPGVGKKTSERICLELRDKFVLPSDSKTPAPQVRRGSVHDDVVSALANLGYKAATAEAAVKKAAEAAGDEADFSLLLKTALRHLTR